MEGIEDLQTALDELGSEELIRQLERGLYQQSFYEFVKRAWEEVDSSKFKDNWHIKVLCDHLQAVTEGKIKRLIVNIPPGYGKSLIVCVFYPAWEWTHSPHIQHLSTSHSQDFSTRDTRRARDLIQSEWYQSLWPIKMKDDQDSKTDYINTKKGYRKAKAFGKLTGGRGHRLLIDDPISANDALSEAARKHVKTITLESVPTRLNDVENDAIIVIAQRLHHEDIVGVLEEADLGYEKLVIPVEYQGNKVFETSLQMEDPRNEIGELLFPNYQSRSSIDLFKRSLGPFGFGAQFQQEPTPRTDGFFDMDTLRENLYEPDTITPEFLKNVNTYLTSDHAPSGTGDNNVIRVWGIDSVGTKWLLDSFVDKCTMDVAMGIQTGPTGQLQAASKGALALIKKYKPICWFPENCNNWKSIEPMVKQAMRAIPNCYTRIKPLSTGGTKEQKATAYDAAIRLGKVRLPKGPETDATLQEYQHFPLGKHDDRVDADGAICRAEQAYPGFITQPAPVTKKRPEYSLLERDEEITNGGFFG